MTLSKEVKEDHILVKILANLDVHFALEVRTLFSEIIANADRNVILDLSQVARIDSSGVGAIVFLFKRLRVLGFCLELKEMQVQPFDLIDRLHINKVIKVNKKR
jgi:anti-anti-sigma factor